MEWKTVLALLGIAIPGDIQRIIVDSREVSQGDLFIAINSGHLYIDEALEKGAWVLSSKTHQSSKVFQVKDTIHFLGLMAREYRKSLKATVIGITGSVGKTSLTQLLAQSLPDNTIATQGNRNNEIGLPLTILNANADTEYLVVEMGVAKPGDMDWLGSIVMPDIGVITHIGPTHLDKLEDTFGVWSEKSKLISYAKQVVLNQDAIRWPIKEALWYGLSAPIKIKGNQVTVDEQEYTYDLGGVSYRIYTYAAAHAVYKLLKLKPNFYDIKWPTMRMQSVRHSSGGEIIADCYNASFLAYIAALQFIVKKPNYLIVLGEMGGLGKKTEYYHEMLGRVLNNLQIEKVVMYGQHHSSTMRTFLGEVIYFDCKSKLKEWIEDNMKKDTSMLIKGSRYLEMEALL